MTEVPGTRVEVATDLYEAAAHAATAHGRTPQEQLEHWARVGRAITSAASTEDIDEVLRADDTPRPPAPVDPAREVDNAEIDVAIAAAVAAADIGAALAAEGQTTVALDAEGRLVEYQPDGTTTIQ
jgi:hypothetical protein